MQNQFDKDKEHETTPENGREENTNSEEWLNKPYLPETVPAKGKSRNYPFIRRSVAGVAASLVLVSVLAYCFMRSFNSPRLAVGFSSEVNADASDGQNSEESVSEYDPLTGSCPDSLASENASSTSAESSESSIFTGHSLPPDVVTVRPNTTESEDSQPDEKYSSDPLDTVRCPSYRDISKERALALFRSITSLDDIMIYSFVYQNTRLKDSSSIWFYGLTAGNQKVYSYYEDYQSGKFELRLCSADDMDKYQVLDSKNLPSGYDYLDSKQVYKWSTNKVCIEQATLDAILKAGHVAPFLKGDNHIISPVQYISDDRMKLGFVFYMTDKKSYVEILEDYSNDKLLYKFEDFGNGFKAKFHMEVFNDFSKAQSVPLNPQAKETDYDYFSTETTALN